jgi:hypothetical protein
LGVYSSGRATGGEQIFNLHDGQQGQVLDIQRTMEDVGEQLARKSARRWQFLIVGL